jgi:Flp pilus assembly protein protease CpaA
LLIVERSDLNLISASLVFLFSIICYRFGLGAGDVKLAALLSLFFLPNTLSAFSDALTGFLVTSSLSILVHLIFGRKLADSIALAPAICGAFIWCAR